MKGSTSEKNLFGVELVEIREVADNQTKISLDFGKQLEQHPEETLLHRGYRRLQASTIGCE